MLTNQRLQTENSISAVNLEESIQRHCRCSSIFQNELNSFWFTVMKNQRKSSYPFNKLCRFWFCHGSLMSFFWLLKKQLYMRLTIEIRDQNNLIFKIKAYCILVAAKKYNYNVLNLIKQYKKFENHTLISYYHKVIYL